MGVDYTDALRVCHNGDAAGMLLSYFMWYPFLLWALVAFVHFFIRDIFSFYHYMATYQVFWLVAFSIQWGVRQDRPNFDDCTTLGLYMRYGMPDPWLVATTVFVATWIFVAAYHRRRLLQNGLIVVTLGWLGYVASAKYNNYVSWEQMGVSLALAAVLVVFNILAVVYVLEDIVREMTATGLDDTGFLDIIFQDDDDGTLDRRKRP